MARSRRGVRKFTEWVYHDKDVKLKIPVQVNDRSASGVSYPSDESPIVFQVKMEDPPIDLKHADVNELKKLVWAEVKGKVAIEWKPHIFIEFHGSAEPINMAPKREGDHWRPFQQKYTSVRLDVKFLDLAELSNGQQYHRHRTDHHTSLTQDGWPEVGPEKESSHFRKDEGRMRGMIPDTPENRQAINNLINGFNALIASMQHILSPAVLPVALEQLVRVGNLKALPAPVQKGGKGEGAIQIYDSKDQ